MLKLTAMGGSPSWSRKMDPEEAPTHGATPRHQRGFFPLSVPNPEPTGMSSGLTVAPVSAAPQWVESACWRAANRVLPAIDPRDREGYIANCIADWKAATPPPSPRSKNTNRNRY
jgi:hypothetical protein